MICIFFSQSQTHPITMSEESAGPSEKKQKQRFLNGPRLKANFKARWDRDNPSHTIPLTKVVISEPYNVKCGFLSLLKDDRLADAFERAVHETTNIALVMSYVVHHALHFSRGWIAIEGLDVDVDFHKVLDDIVQTLTSDTRGLHNSSHVLRKDPNSTFLRGCEEALGLYKASDNPPPQRSYLNNCLYDMRINYATVFRNHVVTNFPRWAMRHAKWRLWVQFPLLPARKRMTLVKRYLARFAVDLDLEDLDDDCTEEADGEVLDDAVYERFLDGVYRDLVGYLPNVERKLDKDTMETNWSVYLPAMYHILRESTTIASPPQSTRTVYPPQFAMCPLFDFMPKYISTDGKQLIDHYRYMAANSEETFVPESGCTDYDFWWKEAFNEMTPGISPPPGSHRAPDRRVQTDGVGASVQLVKAVQARSSTPRNRGFTPVSLAGIETVLGCDPGKGDLHFSGGPVGMGPQPDIDFRYSFSEYYERSGVNASRRRRERELGENPRIAHLQSTKPSAKTTDPVEIDALFVWFLLNHRELLAFYARPVFRKLKWDVYRGKQREVERACRYVSGLGRPDVDDRPRRDLGRRKRKWIVRTGKTIAVAWGSTNVNAIQGISGNSGPALRIRKQLAAHVGLLEHINEAWTSKACHACCSSALGSNPADVVLFKTHHPTVCSGNHADSERVQPWKLLECWGCGLLWNRDRNGALNIRMIFLHSNSNGGERPWMLKRGVLKDSYRLRKAYYGGGGGGQNPPIVAAAGVHGAGNTLPDT